LFRTSAVLSSDAFAGKKKKFKEGQAEQVLDDLFFEAIKGVERLKPKVVIFENVMGLLFKKNKTYVDKHICTTK
jgi:DNA (cytosine-5)-methyltransferase 1